MDTRAVTYSYTSTGSAVAIKDKSTASKSMTLTDNATITDLNVKVTLYHTRYADLKFELIGPDNVTRDALQRGRGHRLGHQDARVRRRRGRGTIRPVYALSNYDGKSTQGKWTLKITDTVKNLKTGSFTSFTLDVVPLVAQTLAAEVLRDGLRRCYFNADHLRRGSRKPPTLSWLWPRQQPTASGSRKSSSTLLPSSRKVVCHEENPLDRHRRARPRGAGGSTQRPGTDEEDHVCDY